MKTRLIHLFTIIVTGICSSNLASQSIEFTPSYGYQFGARVSDYYGYLKASDSDQFGLNLAVEVQENLMAEVSYIRHATELSIKYPSLGFIREVKISDMSMDWFFLGASKYFKDETEMVRPFFGGGLGLVVISPEDYASSTRLSFALKGGVNIMFTDRIGLNLQGNLMVPVQWGGFYIGVGSGGPSSGVSLNSTTILGGFSGGLVFKLK